MQMYGLTERIRGPQAIGDILSNPKVTTTRKEREREKGGRSRGGSREVEPGFEERAGERY